MSAEHTASSRIWRWAWMLPAMAMLVLGMRSETPDPEHTDDSYRFPMQGNSFLLSGTFGELRGNHFHSGLDVKTGGEVGKPLFAVRDGYVYRIKVSPYGFGKAIYLRHADGEFSVYGHMDGFTDDIEDYVYRKQYASKQYEQEIYLPEEEMPVKKGQLIGYSGNSGSSMGPHLHFEIRDPDERITNPLKHYTSMIQDNVKPIVQHIGIEPLEVDSRVNGIFEKLELVPDGGNGRYSIPGVVEVTGKVGLEYHAYDLLNGAGNHCGINYVKLYLDDQLIYEFALDQFAFDQKKFINVHFDYLHYKQTNMKYQRCYRANGNELETYGVLVNNGTIELTDDREHDIRMELADGYRNTTVVSGRLRRPRTPATLPAELRSEELTELSGYARRNVYVAKVHHPSTGHLRGLDVDYEHGTQRIRPAYYNGKELVFLINLNKWRLPTAVRDPLTNKELPLHFVETVLPDKNNIVEHGELQAYFPYGCLFDSLQLHVKRLPGGSGMYSDVYEVGNVETPLFKSFVLNFKPEKTGNPQHMVIARRNGSGRWSYIGNEVQEDGSIYASSSSFGAFCLMADSVAPVVKPLNFSDGGTVPAGQSSLRLRITDDFSGINSQKILCTIDGSWELFAYDAKSATISHELKKRPGSGKHLLEVMVYDGANNLARKTFTLYF